MFLRPTIRRKDGKEHRYWSLVENKRVSGGRVVQRHVLYLGEINSSQQLAWRKSIEVLEDGGLRGGGDRPRTLALFPDDCCEGVLPEASVVRLKLSQLRLSRPRQWGACWLALKLWEELRLDRFWAERLAASRKGTRWDQVLLVLVAYRLIAPGAEWRFDSHLVKGLAGGFQNGVAPGEFLPTAYCGIDVERIELEPISAKASARFLPSLSPDTAITGTSLRPSISAALNRPWPAMTLPSSSARIG
jgi:hypothetical protein